MLLRRVSFALHMVSHWCMWGARCGRTRLPLSGTILDQAFLNVCCTHALGRARLAASRPRPSASAASVSAHARVHIGTAERTASTKWAPLPARVGTASSTCLTGAASRPSRSRASPRSKIAFRTARTAATCRCGQQPSARRPTATSLNRRSSAPRGSATTTGPPGAESGARAASARTTRTSCVSLAAKPAVPAWSRRVAACGRARRSSPSLCGPRP